MIAQLFPRDICTDKSLDTLAHEMLSREKRISGPVFGASTAEGMSPHRKDTFVTEVGPTSRVYIPIFSFQQVSRHSVALVHKHASFR